MANTKVTEITVGEGRAKGTNVQFRVSGELTLNGKVVAPFAGGIITAKDAKQAARYALAHARYLGFGVGAKLTVTQL